MHRIGRHRAVESRSLHLIDLENLVSGVVTADSVRAVWQQYEQFVGLDRDDSVVVSVSKRFAQVAAFNLPAGVRRVFGANIPDGADIALVEAVDVRQAANRYQHIYLATCDGFFTGLTTQFRAAGCSVTQVVGSAGVATRLRAACSASVVLPSAQAA